MLGLSCIPDHHPPPNRSDNRSPSAAPDAAVCQMGLAHMRPEGLQILPLPSLCSLSSLRSFSSACIFHSMPQYKHYSYQKNHTNLCPQTWKFDWEQARDSNLDVSIWMNWTCLHWCANWIRLHQKTWNETLMIPVEKPELLTVTRGHMKNKTNTAYKWCTQIHQKHGTVRNEGWN